MKEKKAFPGYLDPADREAEIILQNVGCDQCVDILSREIIPINNGKIKLAIPAGIFRIIDLVISK